MKKLLILAAGLTLAGCQAADQLLSTQRPPSAAVKAGVIKGARDYLRDPYSVRDAEISSVMDFPTDKGMQFVCVKANAKNAMGGYTGRQAVSVRLVGSTAVSTLPNATACDMAGLKWYPFKELENL